MAGDAGTLRDYWSGHGHAGPSHGAERDAIGWGTPGDFMRCVAQVTEHGHMTPEQAKGYCNLRHHDALGYYPAQHARMEKAQGSQSQSDGGGEARVAAGSGVTSGQWTTGSDGPTQNPPKPNPYAKKPAAKKPGAKKKPPPKKAPPKKKPAAKKPPAKAGAKPGGKSQAKAQIRQRIAGLEQKLSGLKQEEASLKAKLPKSTASTGASSSSTSGGTKTGTASSSSSPSSSSSSSSSSKPGSSSSSSTSQVQQQLQQVRAQIQQVHQQIAQLRQQLAKAKAWEAEVTKAGRNVRDSPSGRFRTFEGESQEASHAFREGRMGDAVDYLGSARALAPTPGHRTTLDTLQRSISRVQHVIPDVTKSFIRGDSIAHGDKTGFHEGSAGNGHVYLRTRDGVRYRVPKKEVRAASDTENEDLYRQETDPGLPEPPEDKETARKWTRGLTRGQAAWFNRNMGENSVNKVGPHGYEHGWVKVGAGEGHPGKEHADHLVAGVHMDGPPDVYSRAADLSDDELRSAHDYLASKPDKTDEESQVQDYLEQELDAIDSNPVDYEEEF